MKLAVSNLATFAMTSESSSAQVVCESNAFIIFSSCQYVNISNIKFLGCGGNQVENVNDFLLQNARFEGEDRYGTALGLVETTGQDSSETALELIETMGQDSCGTALKLVKTTAQITGSAFLSNTKGTLTNIEVEVNIRGVPYSFNDRARVGGAVIATHSIISIRESIFENNGAEVGGALFVNHSSVTIDNTTFIENHGSGGGVSVFMITLGGALYQKESHVTITSSHFSNNTASYGGAVFAVLETLSIYNGSQVDDNRWSNVFLELQCHNRWKPI